MEFKDLKIGDSIYILENAGTFRKVNTYNIGTITQISGQYDDMSNPNPYMAQTVKRKLIDITISCEGVSKKLTVGADKSTITDSVIGLTVSTNKNELITQVTNQCKEYESKIKAIEFYKNEIKKCQDILGLLREQPQRHAVPEQKEDIETIKVS